MSYLWHVFGAEVPDFGWALVTFGESTLTSEEAAAKEPTSLGTPLAYLATFDHEPTEDEKEAFTPEDYRDE